MRAHRMLALMVLLSTLAACEFDDEGGEEGEGSGIPASGGTCNDANEACGPSNCGGEGGTMLPGSNCMACHDGSGGGEEEAPRFGVAGTVFTDIDGGGKASNATVFVTDATGESVTLTTNSVGNFYTTRQLTPPLTAEVEADGFTAAMTSEVSTGACNSCHQCDGAAGGKLYTQ